jgi:hypothetical protein
LRAVIKKVGQFDNKYFFRRAGNPKRNSVSSLESSTQNRRSFRLRP